MGHKTEFRNKSSGVYSSRGALYETVRNRNEVQLSERRELLHKLIDWLTMHALHSESKKLNVEFPFMLLKQCQQRTQPMDISHYVGLHRKLLELFRVI